MKDITYSLDDGVFLVRLARKAISEYLSRRKTINPPEDTPKKLKSKAGVFVTLETYPAKDLRGCIGYPEPLMPLVEATIKSAISAATQDPRFPPVLENEMKRILVEVSILTPPKLIEVDSPKEYLSKIEIGRDGLIVERGFHRGLLLPQVPVDEGWDREEFLSHTCMKAGLMPDSWYDKGTKVYKFEGIVFAETEPEGKVVQRVLRPCK
jgi:hypothetical protein